MERVTQRLWLSKIWPVFVVCICFCAGGFLGCLFAAFACEESVLQIGQYLSGYVAVTKEACVPVSVPAVLWNHGRWFLGCVVFGLTGLGTVVLPALFGMRGFLLAFGISCFFRVYGGVGLIPALLLFVVPALLWAPGLFLSGVCGLRESARLFRNRVLVGSALAKGSTSFWRCVLLSVLLLVLCVCVECGLLPALLPSAVRILG